LFVALTKPPTKWGVPFDGFVANGIITSAVTVLIIHSPPGFLLGVVIHFGLRELCRVDPHFFRKWRLFAETKMRSRTGVIWGGSRLQPSPYRVTTDAEFATSV